jgi:hypothetical protein
MDELLQQGAVSEERLLEDFQHVDYLTTRIARIKQMLQELSGRTWRGCNGLLRLCRQEDR